MRHASGRRCAGTVQHLVLHHWHGVHHLRRGDRLSVSLGGGLQGNEGRRLPGHGDLPGDYRLEPGVCLEAWSPAMGVEVELRERMEETAARFPQRLSAIIPILYLVQQQYGHVTKEGMELAAEVLGTTPAYIDSVASFYTMLYRQPVGRYVLQICRTLPCALMGAEDVIGYVQDTLGIKPGETTPDQLFTLETVECLAACHVAPLMMVNEVYKVHLDRAKLDAIINECSHGTMPHSDEIYRS